MTVVAYDGRVLAADSQAQDEMGGVFPLDVQKLQRRDHEGVHYLFGGAGEVARIGAVFEAFLHRKILEEPLQCRLLVVVIDHGEHQAFTVDGCGLGVEVTGQPYAIGSGGDYARGAMMAGADAVRAVGIAIACDTGCGGKVATQRLVREELIA